MQRGIRHLRELKVWYRPDVMYADHNFGGMREWVENYLEDFKARNPEVKVEVHTVTDPMDMGNDTRYPRMAGYYLNGTATTFQCAKFGAEAINQFAYEMRNTTNTCAPRPSQNAVIDTECESVQGMWTPYLFMADRPLGPEDSETVAEDMDDRWKKDIKDIARYVRLKKEHREDEFETRYQRQLTVKRKMEQRWESQVFPYTVGHDTQAVPGRVFLEDTKTIFSEVGGTEAPRSAQEPGGGGFMGGFVKPFDRSERAAVGGAGEDKYMAKDFERGGSVPPFAGAPFTSGYGDYENFWKNWDLFNYTSRRYHKPRSQLPPASMTEERLRATRSTDAASQFRRESHYANSEHGHVAHPIPTPKSA